MRMTDYATGIQHIGIPTNDMVESMLFYTELGFEIDYCGMMPENNAAANFVKLGNLVIELYESEEPAMCWGGIDHISINVTDVQGAYDLICSRGLNNLNDEIHFLPFYKNGVKYFIIEGPNKERIEFNQIL